MAEKNLDPIPIPPKQRWREFRIAYLPPTVFILLIAVISWMWRNYVQPGAIIGEVEMTHVDIIAASGGTVEILKADYLQSVTNGQEVAVISGLDSAQLQAEIAAAEADLRLMKSRMDIDKTRNLNSYGQLRVALLGEKFNLDVARIRLQQAQQEFDRAQKLLDNQIISRGMNSGVSGGSLVGSRNDFGYEVAQRDRDALQIEIDAREKAAADLENNLAQMEKTGVVKIDAEDAAVEKAIAAQRERILQLQKPLVLRSPIDGFVSAIKHRTGERIGGGEPVLVISGQSSSRIVAWAHSPLLSKPNVGDIVQIRPMGLGRPPFEGAIVRVGSQLEPVSPMLSTPTANPERIEVGLPVLVLADQARTLIPGEALQLRVIKHAPVSAAN